MTEHCDHDRGWQEYGVDECPEFGGRTVHKECPADDCEVKRHSWEEQPTLKTFTGGEARAGIDC